MAATSAPSPRAGSAYPARPRGERFCYEGYELEIDGNTGDAALECHYSLDDLRFTERFMIRLQRGEAPGGAAGPREAARLVHLLAGISYYKTLIPPVIDLGELRTTPAERAFLRTFFLDGLAEMAYRSALDLSDLQIVGADEGEPDGNGRTPPVAVHAAPAGASRPTRRPLVPFGGGIDSIVTAEAVRRRAPDTTLFVVAPAGSPFAAADAAISVSGLPVVRVERALDPQVLHSTAHGFRNGHVPVTGILSALAVLAAVLDGRDAVVMSNEHSASVATLTANGRAVNHQWSKGAAFEDGFRALLQARLGPVPDYFSYLRARSELWVGQRFAQLGQYHPAFRSCNRAFHVDPDARATNWCGRCDKCCFIDLVLAPFLDRATLAGIFKGREPLDDPGLAEQFRVLLGSSPAPRPFECVGDVTECQVAARYAATRPDRATSLLAALVAELDPAGAPAQTIPGSTGDGDGALDALLQSLGADHVPDAYAPAEEGAYAPAEEGAYAPSEQDAAPVGQGAPPSDEPV